MAYCARNPQYSYKIIIIIISIATIKSFSACFKFLDYEVLMYRYTAEGKQILSVNGCTGQSKFLHVNFFSNNKP